MVQFPDSGELWCSLQQWHSSHVILHVKFQKALANQSAISGTSKYRF